MGNSSYKQKTNILQGFQKICEDPQNLMGILELIEISIRIMIANSNQVQYMKK